SSSMAKTFPLPANQVGSPCESFSFASGRARQIFRSRSINRSFAEPMATAYGIQPGARVRKNRPAARPCNDVTGRRHWSEPMTARRLSLVSVLIVAAACEWKVTSRMGVQVFEPLARTREDGTWQAPVAGAAVRVECPDGTTESLG